MAQAVPEVAFLAAPQAYTAVPTGALVADRAARSGDRTAFIVDGQVVTWTQYHRWADSIAAALGAVGIAAAAPAYRPGQGGAPVTVHLPDGPEFHAALIAVSRRGRIALGVGRRCGAAETAHLMATGGSTVLVTAPVPDEGLAGLVRTLTAHGATVTEVITAGADGAVHAHRVDGDRVLSVEIGGTDPGPGDTGAADRSGAGAAAPTDAVTLLNSTSGTTGMAKIVAHTEAKWTLFAAAAARGAALGPGEVICSAVPGPYGFGLWSAHFLPALLGAPTVVQRRFQVDELVDLLVDHRVTVLCCVTTQLKMLLATGRLPTAELSALRVVYTGGEAVPASTVAAFEEATGAVVLQFYGSNEAGAVSATTVDDDAATRRTTSGRIVPGAQVSVRDADGREQGPVGGVRRGQAAVAGPLVSQGYWTDRAADAALRTEDGAVLLGDVIEIDGDGRVRVIGREADLIIRGGKNISAVEVEALLGAHPRIGQVCVVGVPDPLFGERVCAVVVPVRGAAPVTVEELAAWLTGRGTTAELAPEHVVIVEALPMAAGGKIAKSAVRAEAAAQVVRGVPRHGTHVRRRR